VLFLVYGRSAVYGDSIPDFSHCFLDLLAVGEEGNLHSFVLLPSDQTIRIPDDIFQGTSICWRDVAEAGMR
jgi:hypothetical protein